MAKHVHAADTYAVQIVVSVKKSDGSPCECGEQPPTVTTIDYSDVPYASAVGIQRAVAEALLSLGDQACCQ